MIFFQLLINGLIAGSIYALVAAGFSLIYSTNRFIHLAHGAVVTASGYFLFVLFTRFSVNFYLAAILAVGFGGAVGWLMYKLVYRPLERRGSSSAVLLIAGVGLLILLENLILLTFGAGVKTTGLIRVSRGVEFFGAIITPLQIVIIISSFILLILVWSFVRYSKLGKTMLAVADNPELAKISGINTEIIYSQSFLIGSAIAGFAGILVALEQNLEPLMGTPLIIKGFTGAIIGGITSLPGAVLGSYLLGAVENLGIWYLPSGWKDAIAFGLLFVFLLFRPSGILGISKGIRE